MPSKLETIVIIIDGIWSWWPTHNGRLMTIIA